MISFDDALRRLAAELELPEPVRSRILLELRSDLESMAEALRDRGLEAAEARRRALEALFPAAEAMVELGRVHRPLYQRLVDRFSERGRHRLERALLTGVAAVCLVGGAGTLARFDLLSAPSPFLGPVLLLTALLAVVGAMELFRLFVTGSYRRRGGRTQLLGLAGATLVTAFGGAVVDLYGVAGRLSRGASQTELIPWLQRSAILLSVALLAATAAGLIWLVASVRAARSELTEAEALGILQREE